MLDMALLVPVGAVVAVVVIVVFVQALQRNARKAGSESERRKGLEGDRKRVDKFLSASSKAPPGNPSELAARFRLLGK